jgi:transporter family protein
MPRWLLFSIITILLWGAWGVVSKVIGTVMSASQTQALSTLGLLPILLALSFSKPQATNKVRGITYALVAGLLVGSGNLAMFKALNLGGKASTVIPLTALYPLVTVVLATIVLSEKPNRIQLCGIGVALIAIYLFNVGSEITLNTAWLLYALVPVALWGVGALIQKLSTNHISSQLSTLFFLLAFVPLAGLIVLVQPMDWTISRNAWILVVALGLLFGLGNLTLISAYGNGGKASIVTPMSGLYSIVTIPLAILLLGERLSSREIMGIALALIAVAALSCERQAQCTKQ